MSNSGRTFAIFASLLCVLSVLSSNRAVAQTPAGKTAADTSVAPYEFKIAHLGMSLEDFKKATGGDTVEVPGPGSHGAFAGSYWERKKNAPRRVPTPLCSDSNAGSPEAPPEPSDGDVACNPSPKTANQNLLQVTGIRLRSCIYHFYKGRLYQISIVASPDDFDLLVHAFSEKYGPAREAKPTLYVNGFGARWASKNFYWQRGTQTIVFAEGKGNGPAPSVLDVSTAEITDPTLAPPAAPKKPLDF